MMLKISGIKVGYFRKKNIYLYIFSALSEKKQTIVYMRLKSYVYRLMGAVCAFAAVACVDRSFNLDDVSTEVTLGSGTTTLPLGYLGKKTLGELLGDSEIDGLVKDEEGNYSFVYAGENSVVEIEDITAEFEIPEIETLFKADYPQ